MADSENSILKQKNFYKKQEHNWKRPVILLLQEKRSYFYLIVPECLDSNNTNSILILLSLLPQ